MQLRYYQQDAVDAVYRYFSEKDGNPLVAMPTASGKSLVIGEFTRRACCDFPGQRILILSHVKELLVQNFQKILTIWPTAPAGLYSAGLSKRDSHNPVTVAGIASVWRKAHLFGHVDLVLIDECHLLSPKSNAMYGRFIADLKHTNPMLKVIGFTATPYRLGLGLLTEGTIFNDICYDLTTLDAFNKLVQEGYLCRLIPKRTGLELNTNDVNIQGGEFVQRDLQLAVDKHDLTRAALNEMLQLGSARKHWLIFAAGVEHAEHVCEALNTVGIRSTVVHSKMSDKARDKAINGFRAGEFRALCNNNVMTTGFDFPGIDLIGMLRPTMSPGLWVQMLGRGTRPAEGKEDCLVLDFAGNTRRLGPINDPVIPRKRGKGNAGSAPVRLCDACNTYSHASATVCACCGAEFPRQLKLQQAASTAEVMVMTIPEVNEIAVDRVTYNVHEKRGHPPSIQVSYYCGLNLYREWVCLEHPGYAGKKAREWWRARSSIPVPQTVAQAIALLPQLRVAKRVRVWWNKKYPEIMAHIFDVDSTL